MAKNSSRQKSKRIRRDDPERETADRRASAHIRRNARSDNGGRADDSDLKPAISQAVEEAIGGMVRQSSAFIEEQIRAGQRAAERLRDGIANSKELNTDINGLVEHLVATTRDLGTTWLELISIIIRAIGAQPSGGSNGGSTQPSPAGPGPAVTQSGRSGGATTLSRMAPADSSVRGIAPQIVVNGDNVKNVVLDLHPRSLQFTPFVPLLMAGDRTPSAKTKSARTKSTGTIEARFSRSPDQPGLILTVKVPGNQPAGIYTGAVVDSKTNEAGGTLSVTVAD